MWTKRKTQGIVISLVGVCLARLDFFLQIEKTPLFYLNAGGILLAFIGIAVYASGMPSTVKKVKVCPACFTKNDFDSSECTKCKKKLLTLHE